MKKFRFRCAIAWSALFFVAMPVSATEVSLVPVSATTDYEINGREIILNRGGGEVTLELRVAGWDPDFDGEPLLRGYDVQLDSSGFTSGDVGFLHLAAAACQTDADCPLDSRCQPTGRCRDWSVAFIDIWHPDFVFYGVGAITGVNTAEPDFKFGCIAIRDEASAADTGTDKYMGTLILRVSADAAGSFTIGFLGDGEHDLIDSTNMTIRPVALLPATITVHSDCNDNGIPDYEDILEGTSDDCNENHRPDECEPDCNANLVADACDIAGGTSVDCDGHGIPDECEPDCNRNGVVDLCDVESETSDDCNANRIPDECEPGSAEDCNRNDVPDLCDIFLGTSEDCNENAVPDDCDLRDPGFRDCTHNGVLDECERDCNRNGVADSCDILRHTSDDANGDGVPDDCFQGFSLNPISATTGHDIAGNEILIPMGGSTVTLEVRIAGWDLDLDGEPRLRGFQATIDAASFSTGTSGHVTVAALPCESDARCFASSQCVDGMTCDDWGTFYVNLLHPDFAMPRDGTYAPLDHSSPNLRLGCSNTRGIGGVDPGSDRYAATLHLDVSPDATGSFTVAFLFDSTSWDRGDEPGAPPEHVPATITIMSDCNENGVHDVFDVVGGTSEDADGDGVPDECTLALPSISATGSRYLTVSPAPGNERVALLVTSPHYPCLHKYVASISGVGLLSPWPMFRLPSEWGAVTIRDPLIVPGTTYRVQTIYEDGGMSLAMAASTDNWGDVIAPWGDIDDSDVMTVIDRFRGSSSIEAVEQVDLYPMVPDGIVDFRDITMAVDAYAGLAYPLKRPCDR